jgi:hypothetical protein
MPWKWSSSAERFWEGLTPAPRWRPPQDSTIEWDHVPTSWQQEVGDNVASWLSPLDWAVAARTCGWEGPIRIECTGLVSPQQRLRANLLGIVLPAGGPEPGKVYPSPWLTLAGPGSVLPGPESPPRSVPDIVEVSQAWWALLSTDRGRHSIANFLGVHLFGFGGQSAAAKAMGTLVGALHSDLGSTATRWPIAPGWQGRRALVVDDLQRFGWRDFLVQALGAVDHDVVAVDHATDPIDGGITLVESIRTGQKPSYEVVFLGLDATPRPAIADLRGAGPSTWAPVDAPHTEAEHLTLLPRLLANRFPTLPIVLFSSTVRRDVLELLGAFGNVVLDFSKPRIADGVHAAPRAAEGFRVAMVNAERIRQGAERLDAVRAHSVGSGSRMGAGARVVDVFLDESEKQDPEDEDARTLHPLVLGGIVLEHPDPSSEDALWRKLWERGLTWGLDRERQKGDSANRDPWRAHLPVERPTGLKKIPDAYGDYEAHCGLFADVLAELDIGVRAVALVIPTERRGPSPGFTDLSFRAHLSQLLELLVADVAEHGGNRELWIDVATRVAPIDPNDLARHYLHFGRRVPDLDKRADGIYTLNPDEVHPIVDAICQRRGCAAPARARASTLNGSDWSLGRQDLKTRRDIYRKHHPRQIHHLADWVARLASLHVTGTLSLKDTPTVHGWFQRGFLVTAGPALDELLTGLGDLSAGRGAADRAPDPARIAAAVARFGGAARDWDDGDYPLLPHLAHAAQELDGAGSIPDALMALFAR